MPTRTGKIYGSQANTVEPDESPQRGHTTSGSVRPDDHDNSLDNDIELPSLYTRTPRPPNIGMRAAQSTRPRALSEGAMSVDRPRAREAGAATAINSINIIHPPESDVKNGSGRSEAVSQGRRNRISHVDNEGYAHISLSNKATESLPQPSSENRISRSNRYSVLEPSSEDRAYVNMIRSLMEDMDENTRDIIERRIKAIASIEVRSNITTTTSIRQANEIRTNSNMRNRTIEDWRSQITEQEASTGGRARTRTSNQANQVMITEKIPNSEENNLFPPGYSILGSINAERSDTRQLTSQRDEIPGSGVLSRIMEESQDEEPKISVEYSNNVKTSVKIPAPEKYDGKPQMDAFEEWMFNMNNFFELSGVPAKQRIRHLPAYLKGKAANFYITHVAPDPNNWTMAKFAKELFVYCFPSNFNELLRSRFDKANQGRRPFTDFGRYMDKLASRLPKVHTSEVPRKIFEGANGYIHTEWRAKGMNYERTSRCILEETALNYEMAMLEMLKEAARSGRNWRRAMDELGDCPSLEAQMKDKRNQDAFQHMEERRHTSNNHSNKDHRSNNRGRGRGQHYPTSQPRRTFRPRNDRENTAEKDELRAKGACLLCKEKGHIARDCPRKKSHHPTTQIRSAAVNVEELARSVDQRSLPTPVLDIFFAGYKTDFVSEHPDNKRREILEHTKERLIPALWDQVPFRTDIIDVPEIDPLDISRFEIEEWGDALILHDWHTGDYHLLTDEILLNDISDIINGIKTEKLCLLLDNSMLRNDDALASVGRGNKELFHIPDKLLNLDGAMAEGSVNETDSEMSLPKLVTISDSSIADDEERWSDNMLKYLNETTDAEQVSQEFMMTSRIY
ncbi:hypothetical protein M422DRAFT_243118 [Sphaerobolus stellatus SS14]|nr:hypothetical protein M422DRAFT_243118 [Sphaerobolus stellatus SS14]